MNEEIAGMTFEELCDRIRHDYNDSLPESAYESVESLVVALKDIEEEKVIFPTATGYSYHCNVLKMQFLHALFIIQMIDSHLDRCVSLETYH